MMKVNLVIGETKENDYFLLRPTWEEFVDAAPWGSSVCNDGSY